MFAFPAVTLLPDGGFLPGLLPDQIGSAQSQLQFNTRLSIYSSLHFLDHSRDLPTLFPSMLSSRRAAFYPHLNSTTLMSALPLRRLREILSRAVPESTLASVAEVPSTQLPRLYSLSMSDGRNLL